LWVQYDFGGGATIQGRKAFLWCAWPARSRFRVGMPTWDKTLPTITSCPDATFRRIGGVPARVLTANQKTVTTDHVAGIAVRNSEIVEVARHYGTTIRTCLSVAPEPKGGSEATASSVRHALPHRLHCARGLPGRLRGSSAEIPRSNARTGGRSPPVRPLAAILLCTSSARIWPCERTTLSSVCGRQSSIARAR
jgi:hypothetical protein